MPIPPGFKEIDIAGFAEANGPWFEKHEGGRLIRGFMPEKRHANSLGIVHGGMLAAFLDSAMGTAVFHTLDRRAVTLRLTLDFLGPGRIGLGPRQRRRLVQAGQRDRIPARHRRRRHRQGRGKHH